MTQHNKLRLPDLLVINSLAVQVWQRIIYLQGDYITGSLVLGFFPFSGTFLLS